jgi:hypothetical protein
MRIMVAIGHSMKAERASNWNAAALWEHPAGT